jgi:hypothetical protein
MSIPVTDFLRFVMPEVLGCPQVLASQHVVDAAIEFCSKVAIWTEPLASVPSVAGQASYAMTPSEGRAVGPLQVYFDGTKLDPGTNQQFTAAYPESVWHTVTGTPLYFTRGADESKITLVPIPETAGLNINMTVSVKPLPTATTLPDNLFYEYYKAITAGAKATLMAMPEQRWTNTQMAAYYEGMFKVEIAGAVAKIAGGKVGARIRVTAHS